MNLCKTSVMALHLAALAASPAAAQEWALEIPGVFAEPADVGEVLTSLLYHPSGELIGIGGRLDASGEGHGYMVRVGLDAQVGDAHQYVSEGGLFLNFNGATLGAGDCVVTVGYSTEQLVTLPFMYAFDRQSGAVLWEQTPTFEEAGLYAITRAGDGYLGVGVKRSAPGLEFDGYLVRVDGSGNLLWQRSYDSFDTTESWRAVTVRENGNILVGGLSDNEPVLVELAPNGGLIQKRRIDTPGTQTLARLRPAADGGYFLAAPTLHEGINERTMWIARFDADNDLRWQYEYRTKISSLFELEATADGGCAVAGALRDSDQFAPIVLRVDEDGEIRWHRRFALPSNDAHAYGVELAELPDGGLVISASTHDFPASDRRLRFYRVDADGSAALPCANQGEDLPVSRSEPAVDISGASISTQDVTQWEVVLTVDPEPLVMDSTLLCGDPCPPPASFCLSSANSVGIGAFTAWTGSSSVAANDGTLITNGLPPGALGVYFRAAAQGFSPLGDGHLCITQPAFRMGTVVADGFGQTSMSVALDHPTQPGAEVLPGSQWFFQLWYRDPAGGPNGSNLSDGQAVRYCP